MGSPTNFARQASLTGHSRATTEPIAMRIHNVVMVDQPEQRGTSTFISFRFRGVEIPVCL